MAVLSKEGFLSLAVLSLSETQTFIFFKCSDEVTQQDYRVNSVTIERKYNVGVIYNAENLIEDESFCNILLSIV